MTVWTWLALAGAIVVALVAAAQVRRHAAARAAGRRFLRHPTASLGVFILAFFVPIGTIIGIILALVDVIVMVVTGGRTTGFCDHNSTPSFGALHPMHASSSTVPARFPISLNPLVSKTLRRPA